MYVSSSSFFLSFSPNSHSPAVQHYIRPNFKFTFYLEQALEDLTHSRNDVLSNKGQHI
jgi:hypothetical protein